MGDGTTDDTGSIQNAANAAAAMGQALFFPPGTYLHNSTVTFNGIVVNGSGGACVLQAGDPSNTAVILTGPNVALRNFVISSAGLTGPCGCPESATVLVSVATQFTVAGNTIVQGPGRVGVYAQTSSVGNISSIAFDGTGSPGDLGVFIDTCFNVSVLGNLFQNEDDGVCLFPVSSVMTGSQFITIQSNTFGNTTYPMLTKAIDDTGSNTISIVSNVIQMANSLQGTNAISLLGDTNCVVSRNEIWNGFHGVRSETCPCIPTGAVITVSQNIIRNVGGAALAVKAVAGATNIQLMNNNFGEAGLVATGPNVGVIRVIGPLSNVGAVQVQNNVYQGHVNNLVNLVYAPNVPSANVTGNFGTQTTLPNVTGF
jgi:hypothetical protein